MNRCLRVAAALGIAALPCWPPRPARRRPPADRTAETIRVPQDVATLAEAVELVDRGGLVLIAPGVYAEQLLIDKADVTVRGEDRNETVIDGEGLRPFGIVASPTACGSRT